MTTIVNSAYTNEQISAWLRGLLTIAWSDGDFDAQEQELITSITQNELIPCTDLGSLEPITPEELATVLGKDKQIAENFLRTAVMIAIADGIYSACEDHLLHKLYQALGQPTTALEALRHTLYDQEKQQHSQPAAVSLTQPQLDALRPLRDWLDGLEIDDPRLARFLCKIIPPQCPFERDIVLFGRKIVHIPPLCKLNPLYEQLVYLRFRALSYLADERGEDISAYI
ncbi:MAG: Mo-dependent nitrogenase C-terminal domain-containing protein [Nostocaceae cyanobacterium]|nr:Mo-dependent nitrogenase C-terminal domain-containing protein [Nostocaceae cyanobacterium]